MINPQSLPIGSDPTETQGVDFSVESHEQPITAGMLLQRARESNGLHIAALAGALKVPVKKLEALEMDRYDLLLDTVFVRALASSVCRTLKMDAVPVLALLPQSALPSCRQAPVTEQVPFSAFPSGAGRSLSLSSVSGPALLAGLLLVAGAAVLVFLPILKEAAAAFNIRGHNSATVFGAISGSAGVGREDNTSLLAPTDPSGANASSIAVSNNSNPDVPQGRRPAVLPVAASELLPQAVGSVSVPVAAASSPASLSSIADSFSDRPVTFSAATQSSWVKVTDAKGTVVLSRTIAPGEAVFAAGALPLSVVVGRADATRVQIRGKAFDLAAYSRENVARFEVK